MILITTQSFPPDRGGIEGLMSGLADALCAEGCDVTVLADQAAASEPPHPCAYQLRRFAGLKPWRRWRKAVAVRAAINAGGVTGVFADSWKSAEKLGALSVPVAVLAHGMEFPAHPSARKAARIRRVVGDADTVIANSSYTAGLVRPYLQGKTRLVVINPPIGPQPPAVDEQLAALRKRLGRKSPVLATVARLEPRKGVDMVIRALPAIRRTFPEVSYLVAGAGGDRERLENLASELGVSECVHFLGAVNDAQKAAVYALADLFVMPVRREGDSVEGFGIVYREANWYGLPVLAGRDGGAVDAVAEGETGALCNGADLSEVTSAILELLGNERERQTMALRAAEVARGPAQWKASVREFLAALEPST